MNKPPEVFEEAEADGAEATAAQARLIVANEAAAAYRKYRIDAATLSRDLTVMEMDRTAMRATIIAELMKGGLKVTAATEQARTTPEYVKISRDIVDKSMEWELAFVEAEFARMTHYNVSMVQLDTYQQQQVRIELEGLRKQIEGRIRQVS